MILRRDLLSALAFFPCTSAILPWPRSWSLSDRRTIERRVASTNQTKLWVIEDAYSGSSFFDNWDFFTGPDPTAGTVNYQNRDDAFSKGLAYIQGDGKVVMKGDNTTWLPLGGNRDSVRIQSQKRYTQGLFILDVDRTPWGCAVWPAWWTVGDNWPYNGEIDIIEGVHDNAHNQATWHTYAGCELTNSSKLFSGTALATNCDVNASGNAGCGITDWSRASYGAEFDARDGGVYAMQWNDDMIAVWFFYRAFIPADILIGSPTPSSWGTPSAALLQDSCEFDKYFNQHQIVFDITFCGQWAGNSYSTTPCPGTCEERIMDPSNFVNASWIINSMKVYSEQVLTGSITNPNGEVSSLPTPTWLGVSFLHLLIACTLYFFLA